MFFLEQLARSIVTSLTFLGMDHNSSSILVGEDEQKVLPYLCAIYLTRCSLVK